MSTTRSLSRPLIGCPVGSGKPSVTGCQSISDPQEVTVWQVFRLRAKRHQAAFSSP